MTPEDYKKLLEDIQKLNESFESTTQLTFEQWKTNKKILEDYREKLSNITDKSSKDYKKLNKEVESLQSNISGTGQAWNKVRNQIKNAGEELGFFLMNTASQYDYSERIAQQYLNINKQLGISGNKSNVVSRNFKDALPNVIRMGATMEELSDAYQSFSEQSGRQNILSKENLENMMAFSKATGISAGETARLYERFTLMGKSIDDSHKMLDELVNSSNKLGINSKKVLSVLSSEMESMQRMSFKGGVKAMTEMAKLAVKMRMEISDMLGMADKFYEPEAAIEAAAQLQLMGGDIAQAFGDPFETMYLARNKPEELAKRLETMTENMVSFNEETGEYDLPAEARQQLSFAAEQLGLSRDRVIDMAIQSSKIKDIKMNVSGNITDDDMRETLAGMAQMKDGRWVVDVGGEQIPIGDITEEQAGKLAAATPEDALKQQALATQTNTQAIENNTEALKAEAISTFDIYEVAGKAFKEPLQQLGTNIGELNEIFKNSEVGKAIVKTPTQMAEEFGKELTSELKIGFKDVFKSFNNEKSLGGVLQRGGVLKGATHSEGGIPFSVGGVPGFEAEHEEIVLTKGVFQDPIKRKIASDLNVSEGGVSFAKGGVPTLSDMSVKAVNGLSNVSVGGNISHSIVGEFKPLEIRLNGLSETTKISPENERKILSMITEQITKGDSIYSDGKISGKDALIGT